MAPLPDDQQPERDVPASAGTNRPLEQPESQMPPQQEGQPAPNLQRWFFGVGAAVILFAVVWVLLNAV